MADGSVDRALAIFETFEREKRSLSAKEIAELCHIPASTCHSLVHTLLKRAYLYQSGRRKDLYPTRRLYDLGATVIAHDPVLERVRPVMEALRDRTRETVILGKRQRDHILYLEVVQSHEVIRYIAQPGDVKPLHSTCIGKAMLSTLAPREIAALLGECPPTRVTASTLTTLDSLTADLEAGSATGVFVTRGENVPDVTALAVTVRLNSEFYGLAVAGPQHRMAERFEEIANTLKAAGDGLSDQLTAAAR